MRNRLADNECVLSDAPAAICTYMPTFLYICTMIKQQLYQPYSISVETMSQYPLRDLKQNSFFEIIYVLSGSGKQRINENKFSYNAGDVFLLTPGDKSCFDIEVETKFFFLRFNNIYLKESGLMKDNIQRVEYILQNANHLPGCIVKNETDKPLLRSVVEGLIQEHINRDTCWEKLCMQLVNTLIVIVGRNIEKYLPEELTEDQEEKAYDLLQYIQANIYDPSKIKAESLSREFGISINYLGRYFKKHTGKTLQDYVTSYKIKLVENRLLHSTMRISEIVDELGFSDESHLNKFFKKQHGINPSEYRRTAEPLTV